MTDLASLDALIPGTRHRKAPYLDHWQTRLAIRRLQHRCDVLTRRGDRLAASGRRLCGDIEGIRLQSQRAIRDFHCALLRVAREQLERARAQGDVPAAVTALQEITDLQALIDDNPE